MLSIPIDDPKYLVFLRNRFYGSFGYYKLSHRDNIGLFIESNLVSKRLITKPVFSGPNTFDVSLESYTNVHPNPCFLPKGNKAFNLYARNLFFESFIDFMDCFIGASNKSIISGISAFVRKYNLDDCDIEIESLRIYYWRNAKNAKKINDFI